MMALKMALRSISSNKLRAVLTMLGIIIGVMALVVLVSLVNGATTSVTDAVSGLGNSMMSVTVSDDKGSPIDPALLNQWSERTDVGLLAPYWTDSATAHGREESGSVTLYGTTAAWYALQGLQMEMGRWLKTADIENHSYVCVLNNAAAEELMGYTDCIGQAVRLDGVEYTIVGVLYEEDGSLTSLSSGGMTVYLPYTSLLRLSDSLLGDVTRFYVSAPEGGTVDMAKTAITELLMERFEEDEEAFSVSTQDVLENAMSSITSVLTILLGGIAAISLVVGGIGIMNIMLVTVTERTREIGIRKAIGASRGTILSQFLMEAVVLCMLGCALGIFLSWAILQTVTTVVSSLEITFSLDGGVVLIAVLFCFVIGLVFGLYPANKAAKMKPIDALHYGG
ncbi:MAG: ABC transporter permease [Oscillospiraceae bacterium]|nr:ABC transporter permease [Oscillospiraceae bacterium]MBQ7000263.1 ABC transporter permease [Oscillospiraceae bacterium]